MALGEATTPRHDVNTKCPWYGSVQIVDATYLSTVLTKMEC